MPNDQFARLLRFAQRTGDRLIVTDEKGNDPMVILSLEQYESLVTGILGPDEGRDHSTRADDDVLEQVEIDPAFTNPPLEIVEDRAKPIFAPQNEQKSPIVSAPRGAEEQFYLEPL